MLGPRPKPIENLKQGTSSTINLYFREYHDLHSSKNLGSPMSMKKTILSFVLTVLAIFLILPSVAGARPSASAKFSTTREENPNAAQNRLILPYAFPSESMGTTAGVGGFAKGYLQDQFQITSSNPFSCERRRAFRGQFAHSFRGGHYPHRCTKSNRPGSLSI